MSDLAKLSIALGLSALAMCLVAVTLFPDLFAF